MSIQTFDEFLNPTSHPSDSIFVHFDLEDSSPTDKVEAHRIFNTSSNTTLFFFQQEILKVGMHLLYVSNQDDKGIGSSPFSFKVVSNGSGESSVSQEIIGGIVGGFLFVLILVAIKFWQHQTKAEARISEEKQRAEEQAERAKRLSAKNHKLSESLKKG